MIINANDRYIGRSIETYGSWAADDIELIKSIIRIQLEEKSSVKFYDVGANIGTHSVALAREFGNKISVRSFEAQRQVYYMLCGNVALNGLENVICHHQAVSDQFGSLAINVPDYNTENNFGGVELIKPVHSDNHDMIKSVSEQVQTVTLDSLNEAVDFVKMDIEGMEHMALAGAQEMIGRYTPICFVEIFKTDQTFVKNFFKQLGYTAYELRAEDWLFIPEKSSIMLDNALQVTL
jgi:FkbM family methyltransferase